MSKQAAAYLGVSKPAGAHKLGRFQALDGMRGIAAFCVILEHLSLNFPLGNYAPPFAYLAVDMFFALSGFVLAYSYDQRFAAGMTTRTFMLQRARRLFPLYLVGTLCGLLTIPIIALRGLPLVISSINSLFLLPGASKETLFPLNSPAWSLFFEFWFANLLLVIGWRVLRGRLLLVLICLASIGVAIGGIKSGWLNTGFSYASLPYGFARTFFSFFLGVVLSRHHGEHRPAFRLPVWLLLLTMAWIFCAPLKGRIGHAHELLAVLIGFPLLIYYGADSIETPSADAEWLGDASYPAYAIHWPFLVALGAVAAAFHWPRNLWIELLIASLVMVFARELHLRFDVPFRKCIARTWPI